VQINGTVFGCIDGDGGINENISSSLTLSNETLLDSCLDKKQSLKTTAISRTAVHQGKLTADKTENAKTVLV
jgi:hypothetical protein